MFNSVLARVYQKNEVATACAAPLPVIGAIVISP
jgi:hypothetical protein